MLETQGNLPKSNQILYYSTGENPKSSTKKKKYFIQSVSGRACVHMGSKGRNSLLIWHLTTRNFY